MCSNICTVSDVCDSYWRLQSFNLTLNVVWSLIQWKKRTPPFLHQTLQLQTHITCFFFVKSVTWLVNKKVKNSIKNKMQMDKCFVYLYFIFLSCWVLNLRATVDIHSCNFCIFFVISYLINWMSQKQRFMSVLSYP